MPNEASGHTGHLWAADGTLLASVTFTNETPSGWQTATLSTPYTITINATYIVSVNSIDKYANTSEGMSPVITNATLSSVDVNNGLFSKPAGTFPVSTSNSSNYFRDIVFNVTSYDTIPPSAPTGLSASNFNDTSFTLNWAASTDNVAVAGYDVYMNGVFKTSVTGTSANITGLTAATTYAMTVKAKDAPDNVSDPSVVLNVTTPASPAAYTLLTTQTPTTSDHDHLYELGMKFQSSYAGKITKIRFYKMPNEGTGHTGRLWSATGTQLVSVSFTGESSSGWQEATLSTPYSIAADTTYVVSVNSVVNYAATDSGFKSAVINGPLSSIVGNNGVYGTPSTFPTHSFANTNYFRDVVVVVPDTTAPSSPTSLSSSSVSSSGFILSWLSATDNVGVTAYDVYLNGTLYTTVGDTFAVVSGLTSGAVYSMTVTAKDQAGNVSAASSVLNVTTTGAYTIGVTSMASANDATGCNYINADLVTAPPGGMTVTSINVYLTDTTTGKSLKCAVYSDAGGAPGTFLMGTNELTSPGLGWQTFTLTSNLGLASNTNYWLAVWTGGEFNVASELNGGTSWYSTSTYGGAWPSSAPSGTSDTFKHSIFAAGTAIGGSRANLSWDSSLTTLFDPHQFKIYPNPVQGGEFFIDLGANYNRVTVDILDLSGRIVYRKENYAVRLITIDHSFSNGMYIVRINDGKKVSSTKLLVK